MTSKPVTPESLVTVGGKAPKKRLTRAQRLRRRRLQRIAVAVVLLPIIVVVWYGFQPLKGTIDYGICRTLAELKVPHLSTMRILSYENYGPTWKIFYTYTGSYGEQHSNYIDCVFTADAQGKKILREVKINREPLDAEELARFNKSIPGIIASKPDLSVPIKLDKYDLRGLRAAYLE
ncbi:MAG: hypothetical protein ACK4NR_01580 [Micavibrio sp.]